MHYSYPIYIGYIYIYTYIGYIYIYRIYIYTYIGYIYIYRIYIYTHIIEINMNYCKRAYHPNNKATSCGASLSLSQIRILQRLAPLAKTRPRNEFAHASTMSSAQCIHPRKREYHVQGSQICQGSKCLRTNCSCSPPCSIWPSPSHILSDTLGTGFVHVRPQVCEEICIQIWMRLLQHSFYSDVLFIFR